MAGKAVEGQMHEIAMSKSELEGLIDSVILGIKSKHVDVSYSSYASTATAIYKAERRAKEITRTFNQTLSKAQAYMEELLAEEKEIENQVRQRELEAAAEECHVIDDDSDDDVTIIDSTFAPRRHMGTFPPPPPLISNPSAASCPLSTKQQPPPLTLGAGTSTQPSTTVAHLRAALTDAINRQVGQCSLPPSGENKNSDKEVYVIDEDSDITIIAPVKDKPLVGQSAAFSNWSNTMPVIWKEITSGCKVLAKKFNDIWYSGVVSDVHKPENAKHAGEWKFRVKFDGKGMKVLPGLHIAYREPINCFLKVGTRVAALYRDDETSSACSFYAGIVAEAPSLKNNRRFLIFFDDGYAQYCQSRELHKVYYQSENVWEDIHPDSQEFIKEYLKQYPERPMVRLIKGQVVKTEWNGRWWTAKVMEVDASLVKMYFQADKRTEWIYRGSTRLEPLFKALANAEAIKAAGSSKGRRLNMDTKGQKRPTVEYTRGGIDTDDASKKNHQHLTPNYQFLQEYKSFLTTTEAKSNSAGGTGSNKGVDKIGDKTSTTDKKRFVARKSTTMIPAASKTSLQSRNTKNAVTLGEEMGSLAGWEAPWLKLNRRPTYHSTKHPPASTTERFQASSISSNKQGRDMASVLQERLSSTVEQGECVDDGEALGERMDTLIDTKDKVRKRFVPHTCNPSCLGPEEDLEKHKGKNPLMIPLLCGWERQVAKMKPGARRGIIYRAPCARRLRTIDELDEYLHLTDSRLVIDYFCFDQWLHVHTEFVPVKTFCDIKDLSYGKENVPISCVNGIDRQYPDYVEYSSSRIPSKGVKMILDESFLQCCDCTDNCRDRSKCACQQLTIENTCWIGERDPNAGYHNRRLQEPIFTGVVECNARCKCDYRCRNRVSQNGLSCRLQVFKTEKRGWGLRCLNDIPKGGFICIYAGQLLTDTGANDDGKQYGDEYLAELDFIEVVERQKEGYECDVVEPDLGDKEKEEEDEDDDDEDYDEEEAGDEAESTDSDFSGGGADTESVERKVHETRRRRKKTEDSASGFGSDQGQQKESKPLEKLVLKRDSIDGQEWTTEKKTADWVEKMDDSPIVLDDEDEDEEDEEDEDAKTKENATQPMEVDELPDINLPLLAKKKEVPQTDKKTFWDKKPKTARKSMGGSRFKNLPNPRMQQNIPDEEEVVKPGTRALFEDNTSCYIMDAKSMGNIGRYLNHSCSPNVFVQNIFVDTHDLRYPWVAFFAGQYIRAGTELTWDYNYEVGSVPDKVLYCYCGSSICRGRLL